jgi:hypothetical protein
MPTLSHRLRDGNVQEMRQAPVASAQTVHARVGKDNHRVLPLALAHRGGYCAVLEVKGGEVVNLQQIQCFVLPEHADGAADGPWRP